jgi:hypothetical protein
VIGSLFPYGGSVLEVGFDSDGDALPVDTDLINYCGQMIFNVNAP